MDGGAEDYSWGAVQVHIAPTGSRRRVSCWEVSDQSSVLDATLQFPPRRRFSTDRRSRPSPPCTICGLEEVRIFSCAGQYREDATAAAPGCLAAVLAPGGATGEFIHRPVSAVASIPPPASSISRRCATRRAARPRPGPSPRLRDRRRDHPGSFRARSRSRCTRGSLALTERHLNRFAWRRGSYPTMALSCLGTRASRTLICGFSLHSSPRQCGGGWCWGRRRNDLDLRPRPGRSGDAAAGTIGVSRRGRLRPERPRAAPAGPDAARRARPALRGRGGAGGGNAGAGGRGGTGGATASGTYDQAVLADGPVGYWAMNKAPASEPDLTGRTSAGTLPGGTVPLAPMPNGDQAADFNGNEHIHEHPVRTRRSRFRPRTA
jgi:hypothetical protein